MAAHSARRLSVVAKQAYYRDAGMAPELAAIYYAHFAGARAILDVGCGTGDFGRMRPSSSIDVRGVDVDALAIAEASQHERALCVDLDRAPLPYANATFDGVLAKDIFEHVQDPAALANEIHRVLQPGGVLVASVVMARPHRVWADYTHLRGFTQRSARLLLEDAGFTVEAVWRMGPVPLSTRLGAIKHIPMLLRVPLFDAWWGASWELRARR